MNKTVSRSVLLLSALVLAFITGIAQTSQKFIRHGNSYYEDGKFKDAEIDYRKALEKSPTSAKATYNLGNSQYKQQNYKEATNSYLKLASDPKNARIAQLYHNLGNSLLQSQKYSESVQAYKQALRINPKDEDTRYNLAYAMAKLQQQQQNKNNKDQNKQKQQQQNQQQQKEQQQNQQQHKQNQKMSKQDAERMLNALKNNEKRTMDKVKKQAAEPSRNQPEIDW